MELHLGFIQILLVFLIVFSGTLLQSSIGFGLGPLAVPLLALIDPNFIPGPLLLSALVLTSMMTWRDQNSIHTQGVIWAIPGRLAGTILGAAILVMIPKESLSLLFGSMVLLAIIISVSGIHPKISPISILTAGVFSGLMGTTSAIGGAPMGLVYQDQKGPKIRGTLSLIFVFGTIISLVSLLIIGHFALLELKLSLILMPGILIGFLVSRKTANILDKGLMRPAILSVSGLAGLAVIIKSIL
ncbi:MAG: sulfite exporter TauE/SafE family protein [Candidatus Aminicenantes bacterium]|nr:sulfite exporter TauE/SafE family protein [Candidatus Aminicenantes bacterium]